MISTLVQIIAKFLGPYESILSYNLTKSHETSTVATNYKHDTAYLNLPIPKKIANHRVTGRVNVTHAGRLVLDSSQITPQANGSVVRAGPPSNTEHT